MNKRSKYFDSTPVSPIAETFVTLSLSFADLMKKAMKEKDIDVKRLTILLGKRSPLTIQRMLTGTYNFSLKEIADISVVLDINISLED